MRSNPTTRAAWTALRRDTVRKVRQVGLLRTVGHGLRKLARDLTGGLPPQDDPHADPFDRRYGTDTARIVSVGALDIRDDQLAHSNRYEAVVPQAFDEIMRDLPIVHEDYTFIDIGAGKGRALLLASRYPFREIVGVELSAALTDIARRNIAVFRDEAQRCHRITALCQDGLSYEPPPGDAVLYLNNPFDDAVMRPLVATLERSLARNRRRLLVVYQRPSCRRAWDESSAFRLLRQGERHLVYEGVRHAQEHAKTPGVSEDAPGETVARSGLTSRAGSPAASAPSPNR